jgi:hypothetical protein
VPDIGYDFGGLLIGSPLDLYGLRPAGPGSSQLPDVKINLGVGALPLRRPITHAWKGRFQLTLEGGGDVGWTIRYRDRLAIECDPHGAVLDCTCDDLAQAGVLSEILARRVLPRLSALHDRLPIHGASLANADGAVLILGTSGAGKSTLTAAMAAAGWDILSDDMSILSGSGGVDSLPQVWQTAPGISLWEPSRRGLGLPEDQCRPIEGYDGKYWFAPPRANRDGPVPVRAIIFIMRGTGEEIDWSPIAGPKAVVMTAEQMVRFDPADIAETGKVLNRLARLAARIPCYELSYPRAYDVLPDVIEAVAAIQADARSRPIV